LRQGESVTLSGYELVYGGLEASPQPNRTEFIARLLVYNAGDGALLGAVEPHRNIYNKTPDQPTSEVGLRMTLVEDVYVVLNGWDEGGRQATFTIYVNPLTMWMWIGGVVLVIGTLLATWPHPVRRQKIVPAVVHGAGARA
jgi:cytochrome c-type biogenesis protein CcmF